ncbi:MAG TPA: MarR family transcriptional regulator [Pyrinomonadaceae bacterium]|nr:MarR family transcriptional regulator [Pyrinomonadaceae bacterium]
MKKSEGHAGTGVDKREHHYLNRMRHHSGKYAEFHWPSVELLVNLAYTHEVIHSHLARRLDEHGLSLGAFNVLMILSRCEAEGSPMHELGELLLVSRANVTGLVDYLARKGLVERSGDEKDRRVRRVRLTKGGQKFLESILPGHYSRVREMFKGVSNKEKAALSELLTKLRRNTQRSLEKGGGK